MNSTARQHLLPTPRMVPSLLTCRVICSPHPPHFALEMSLLNYFQRVIDIGSWCSRCVLDVLM